MNKRVKKYWIDALNRLKESEDRGTIIGVEICKPRPWPPALEIIKLREAGLGLDEIAKEVGYSVYTVERALKTRGEDLRTGPQCSRYAGRVFSVEEALKEMPIPCGPDCVCWWGAVFEFENR